MSKKHKVDTLNKRTIKNKVESIKRWLLIYDHPIPRMDPIRHIVVPFYDSEIMAQVSAAKRQLRYLQSLLGKPEEQKHNQKLLRWFLEGQQIRPGIKPLTPEDLPQGVRVSRSYDRYDRGLVFFHYTFGVLGELLLRKLPDGQTLLDAEFFRGQDNETSLLLQKRRKIFGQIFKTIDKQLVTTTFA